MHIFTIQKDKNMDNSILTIKEMSMCTLVLSNTAHSNRQGEFCSLIPRYLCYTHKNPEYARELFFIRRSLGQWGLRKTAHHAVGIFSVLPLKIHILQDSIIFLSGATRANFDFPINHHDLYCISSRILTAKKYH